MCNWHAMPIAWPFMRGTTGFKVFHMLFERCHNKLRKRSLKQHIKYFNFRSNIQLDHPVREMRSFLLVLINLKGVAWDREKWGEKRYLNILISS